MHSHSWFLLNYNLYQQLALYDIGSEWLKSPVQGIKKKRDQLWKIKWINPPQLSIKQKIKARRNDNCAKFQHLLFSWNNVGNISICLNNFSKEAHGPYCSLLQLYFPHINPIIPWSNCHDLNKLEFTRGRLHMNFNLNYIYMCTVHTVWN